MLFFLLQYSWYSDELRWNDSFVLKHFPMYVGSDLQLHLSLACTLLRLIQLLEIHLALLTIILGW